MPIERISTRSVHQRTLVDFNRVQSHLLELQKQISSGIKTDDFKGLAGQVEQFTNLDGKIRKAVTYQESNEIVITRIQTANVAFDGMVETVNDIKNLLVQWRDPGLRPTLPFTQQMEAFKKTLTGQLNQTADGRFLFGGSRTDIPPVIDPLPAPVSVGTPDDSYYQGSKEDIIVRAQDNQEIRYNIRADNEAFQNVFAGMAMAAEAHALDDDERMITAFNMVNDGLQGIIALQAENNQNSVTIRQINDRHKSLQLYWQGVTEEVSKTDIVAASTEVAVDQAVLTATFQAFSSINRLRLSDFL